MFIRDRGLYLYICSRIDNAETTEEYEKWSDILKVYQQNEEMELFIEEPEEWEKYRDIFEDDYLE